MIRSRSNLIRLEFADVFGSVLLVVLGIVENRSTLLAIHDNRVMDVSTGSAFRNALNLVVGKFRPQGLEDIDFSALSEFFVSLPVQLALQVSELVGELQPLLKAPRHLGVELLLSILFQNLSLSAQLSCQGSFVFLDERLDLCFGLRSPSSGVSGGLLVLRYFFTQ